MSFTFHPLDENSAQAILHWQYEPPYDMYDLISPDPESTLQYLLDSQNAFYSIYGQNGDLEAFCSFGLDGQVTVEITVFQHWISAWAFVPI